jgi:NADH-quinone oxidoreductase subunit A
LPNFVKKITKLPTQGSAVDFDLQTFYPVLLFALIVLIFAVTNLVATQLIGPHRRTVVKLMPYESGMDPIGDARARFDVKFYLIAILFLVFDVELLFLYPWAVATFRPAPGDAAAAVEGIEPFRTVIFWEVLVFLATLAVAYVYAWRKGVFRWR